MVLPNTFYHNSATNTLNTYGSPSSTGPYTNTWSPQNAIKEKFADVRGNLEDTGKSVLASVFTSDPIHKTVAKAGLSYLGFGPIGQLADYTTRGLNSLAGDNKIAKGFINYGPLGALYAGISGN